MTESSEQKLFALYQDTILDHGLRPRNYRPMVAPDSQADGVNHLCGDQISVYVRMGRGRIRKVTFTGTGCAICKASASLMTTWAAGQKANEALVQEEALRRAISNPGPEGDSDTLGVLTPLIVLKHYPGRTGCAILPWQTLARALKEQDNNKRAQKEGDDQQREPG